MFVRIKVKSGLTLIELMIAIGLLTIVLGMAIPLINQNWIPRYRLKIAARDLASNLQLARLRAITLNQNCGIFFGLGAGTYTLFRDDGSISNQYDASDTVDKANIALPSGVSFTGCTFANNAAIFRPGGTSSGGSVDVQNSLGTKSVTVLFTTGRIKIQ